MAGDMMQDLKAGHLLRVKPERQMVAQVVGLVASALVIGLVVSAINQTYGIGNVDFPAPQAVAIKEIVQVFGFSKMLFWGMVVGGILTLVTNYLRLGIVAVAFGIGLYVPIELSFPLFIGGCIRHFVDRKKRTDFYRIIAAGVISGEGLVGVVLALLAFARIL